MTSTLPCNKLNSEFFYFHFRMTWTTSVTSSPRLHTITRYRR